MAAIKDKVLSVGDMRALAAEGHGPASYALSRNKQRHYESYETLACALDQALAEIDRLTLLTKEK